MFECAICGRNLGYKQGVFFCNRCYRKWKKEIRSHQSWITYLINNEQARRRWDTILVDGKRIPVKLVRLGNKYDISGDGSLVVRED